MTDIDQRKLDELKQRGDEALARQEAKAERALKQRSGRSDIVFNPCDRCGRDVSLHTGVAFLADIYAVQLCIACINDWQLFAGNDEDLEIIQKNDIEHQVLLQQVANDGSSRSSRFEKLRVSSNQARARLLVTAQQWVKHDPDQHDI